MPAHPVPCRRRRRLVAGSIAFVLALGVAFGLVWFQPWKLFLDHRVDEQLPAVALASPAAVESVARVPLTPGASARPATPAPALLSRGRLISHEHSTSGTVGVVRQADGSLVLAVADLDTSDGPDVHVWLTDAPVIEGGKGWHVFDDGRHVDLGTLKGNLGNQVYRIPEDADLTRLTSVAIWCDRFGRVLRRGRAGPDGLTGGRQRPSSSGCLGSQTSPEAASRRRRAMPDSTSSTTRLARNDVISAWS